MAEQARLMETEGAPLYTIGHSTRSLDDLVALLDANDVVHLFDVRRFPRSRRHPHFNKENLDEELAKLGLDYTHLEALGGRRSPPAEDSPNAGWDAQGFQAYADHARTQTFAQALEQVLDRADELAEAQAGHTCIMCAEIVYFRCHRRIISDHVLARGRRVYHIFEKDRVQEHELPAFARVRGRQVVYPG